MKLNLPRRLGQPNNNMGYKEPNHNHKQRIRFSEKELPELKNWPINQKYTLQIEVRLKNKGDDMWEETGMMGGIFTIEAVKAIEEDKIKKLEQKYKRR